MAPGFVQPGDVQDPEGALRWLARTQKLDGSWNEDVEWTAAAVLAFVRAGHTTRVGNYRQALRRAARYLVGYAGTGIATGERIPRFLCARALAELADATGGEADRAAAQASRLALPPASNDLEAAALGQPVQAPGAIASLDDLRLASMLRAVLPVPQEWLSGEKGDLPRVWATTLRA